MGDTVADSVASSILHHERVVAEGAVPGRWLLVLHGLFGSGRNWAGVARRIVRARPEWGAVLVDLREHGRSTRVSRRGGGSGGGPNTLDAAARDVRDLVRSLNIAAPAVLGHSFGGKVAMLYASREPAIDLAFIIDSTPARVEGPGDAGRMIEILRELPDHYASREDAIAALESRGLSRPVAQWMTMNLEPEEGGFRWRMDLHVSERLYHDFREQDLWPAVEGQGAAQFHFIRAKGSDVVTPQTRDRLRSIRPQVHLHEIDGGHWLNVDNPDAVVRIVADNLAA